MMQFGDTWKRADVVRQHTTPRSYIVSDEQNRQYRRNRKFLRPTKSRGDFNKSNSFLIKLTVLNNPVL